ncbi:MAG: SLC13 family permease [Methanothrix soehngenii]|jgi:di/tricarboxylate transporter|uniref:SLC13 family permease n=1 Tax=Methanothrix soehngenii TaxID=2223 RepID=UPI0023EFA3CD|nr:SLC13 family permease [Methanothrix soehngenii]MDD3974243.1 SLC13 family permease [Methanothrix soehngenii]MDD5257526.1 SLC13 family permease [Methanothrix soehngenii]MDD5735013.1 SLC13 family permease [Methanothrix soehngenii]
MDSDQAAVFIIITIAFAFFIWGRWRYDLVAMMALLTSVIAGVVPWSQAFSGFAHPAVITVAAVLIISRCFLESDLIEFIFRRISKSNRSVNSQALSLTGLVALLSGFMNNVGALALLMPVSIRISRSGGSSPSLYLMTLAFGSLLGGLITLIGTPPNIIISTFRADNLGQPFTMFDFTPVGLGVAFVGLVFISLIGWRLTPIRQGQASREEEFEVENYYTEVRIPKGSTVLGKSINELLSAAGSDIEPLGLWRENQCLPGPNGSEVLLPDDILIIRTNVDDLDKFLKSAKRELVGSKEIGAIQSDKIGLTEVVVMNNSLLAGRSASSISMRGHYGVNLIAVAGRDSKSLKRLSRIIFHPGDVLLLQGSADSLPGIAELLGCLPLAERDLKLGQAKNMIMPLVVFALAIVVSALGLLSVEVAFIGAATVMVLMGILSLQEAYESIDWSIIVLLGAMIPVSQALESSGGAELLAGNLLQVFGQFPAAVILTVLLVWTMVLTNVVNNAAAAVLMAPIAYDTALVIGASPDPFLMTIAIGASCAFLTPIGHQSNTLVMGPGGYKFGDYWHMGLPLSIIVTAVTIPLILWFWPLF